MHSARETGQKPESTEEGIMGTITLDISEARRQFTKLDERLREDRVIWITRHNKKAFAVVDTDLLQTILETIEILSDPDALKMFQEGLRSIRAGRLHDHEEIKSELLNGTESYDPMDGNSEEIAEKSSKKVHVGLLVKADALVTGGDPRKFLQASNGSAGGILPDRLQPVSRHIYGRRRDARRRRRAASPEGHFHCGGYPQRVRSQRCVPRCAQAGNASSPLSCRRRKSTNSRLPRKSPGNPLPLWR